MEKKTTRMVSGCKTTDGGRLHWNSAAVIPENSIAATIKEVEFSNWVDDFMAEERATSTVDYSKPGKLTRPFIIRNVIDDDLNLLSPPPPSSIKEKKEEEKEEKEKKEEVKEEEYDYNKENYYDDELNKKKKNNDYLKKKMNDALMKRKKIAQEEEQLLNELKRVRVRAAEIDKEYREYQEKIAAIL